MKHKNLMEVFGVCFEKGHISLIIEYMPNSNLRQVLDNDFVPLTWKTKLRIAQQVIIIIIINNLFLLLFPSFSSILLFPFLLFVSRFLLLCSFLSLLFVFASFLISYSLLLQIADGMSYLVTHPDPDIHIHENLKSGNIHVNVDRGIVKITGHGQGVLRDLARTMTSVDNIAWTGTSSFSSFFSFFFHSL